MQFCLSLFQLNVTSAKLFSVQKQRILSSWVTAQCSRVHCREWRLKPRTGTGWGCPQSKPALPLLHLSQGGDKSKPWQWAQEGRVGASRHTLCTEVCQGWALTATANHSVKTLRPRGLVRRVKGGSPGGADRHRNTGQSQKLEGVAQASQLLSPFGDQRGLLRTPL